MAHFLIINTGGTIGMVEGPNGLEPSESAMSTAFADLPELADWQQHTLTWEHWSPLLDSSNLQPEHWFKLRDTINAHPQVDGVLVIHGTDTLSYTAAALSFLLATLDKPVVITGSMLPIFEQSSDAPGNLKRSLAALMSKRKEVMVTVGDDILPGSRVTKSSTLTASAFSTPAWTLEQWHESIEPSKSLPIGRWQGANIQVVTLFPGIDLNAKEVIENNADAVLINAFGNGNCANTETMKTYLAALHERNIPVFVRSQCLEGNVNFGQYEASQTFVEGHAISCGTMPFEAALTKLMLLASERKSSDEFKAAFQTPWAREWQ